MGNPSHDLGLSTLNGVTFSAGAMSQITGATNADYYNNTFTATTVTTAYTPGRSAMSPVHGSGIITLDRPGAGINAVIYGYSNQPNSYTGKTFGTLYAHVSTGQYYNYNIVGFAYNALLISASGYSLNYYGVSTGRVYILNLTYGDNSLVPPTPFTYPLTFSGDSTALTTPPCFAEGVRVRTLDGEVAVEDLVVGDELVTVSGETRPVIWIGSRRVRPSLHERPWEVNPVRIRKGAFGDALPARDLVVSPGHAVYVDGVLIPAGCLINGATIVQEAVEAIRYFHIELDGHDVLLAEGLPCESYLDDGNREVFGNSTEHTALHGRLDPLSWDQACAPMVAAGPQLIETQQRLHARAEALGWTRSVDPGLALIADGATVAPVMVKSPRAWFAAPAARGLVLRSNAGVLAQLLPGCDDGRRLGVSVSSLSLDGRPVDLAQAFSAGAYGLESFDGVAWRWTDGEATLGFSLDEPSMIEVTLHMVTPSWIRPSVDLRLVEAG